MSSPSGAVQLKIIVQPNAGRDEITSLTGGVWHVKVAAPPVQGKANRELVDFLSRTLGISKSSLTILKGHTSRLKVIAVSGLSQEDLDSRLRV